MASFDGHGSVFTLFDPTLNAPNWRAEQALRPAVAFVDIRREVDGKGTSSATRAPG
jgi:hypothetical protein